jgi:LMBR1 domain-containing protein 1
LVGFLGFIGWFFFAVYAGIGLVSLPLDLCRAFYYRPRFMPRDLYAKTKLDVAKRTSELMQIGETLKGDFENDENKGWKKGRELRKLYRQFRQEVINLEDDYEDLKYCHENWKSYNPLIPFSKLILGICGVILTVTWVLHIILYMLARSPYPDGTPVSFFLNTFLSWASKQIGFSLLGTVFVGIFCVYLLLCTMAGTAKLGVKFLLVEIHPLKFGGTYMSSMLFNLSLLLLCVPPLIQFCSAAFAEYLVLTEADTIFSQFVRYMQFFRFFFDNNIFVIALLVVMVLALVFLLLCGQDKNMKSSIALRERIRKFDQMNKRNEKLERRGKTKTQEIEMT